MPELKDVTIQGFTATEIDFDKIPYQEKIREQQRQTKLESQKDGDPKTKQNRKRKIGNESTSWSKRKDRSIKRAKRKARQEFKRKQKHQFDENDLDELAAEVRLVKKLKTGKISKEEFDDQFVGSEEKTDST